MYPVHQPCAQAVCRDQSRASYAAYRVPRAFVVRKVTLVFMSDANQCACTVGRVHFTRQLVGSSKREFQNKKRDLFSCQMLFLFVVFDVVVVVMSLRHRVSDVGAAFEEWTA